MSGHSKWATIKRQKGINDLKRGKEFTKLSMAITAAVREGGNVTDPEGNFKLRIAMDAARRVNMPKVNIERALERASGKQGTTMIDAVYEGFGPGGFSVIVKTLTDNKQRTYSEVKNVFDKNGGNLGSVGSAMYQFVKMGLLIITKGDKALDEIFLIISQAGAEDMDEAGSEILIYTRPEDMARVRAVLEKEGFSINSTDLVFKPLLTHGILEKSEAEGAIAFVERIEDIDDVQKVFVNFDIPDNFIDSS